MNYFDNFAGYSLTGDREKFGYSVSCSKCNNPISSVLKGGYSDKPIKKCVFCSEIFQPSKIRVGSESKPTFNEEGRGFGFDFSGPDSIIIKGIFPPEKLYTMICKRCGRNFQYKYGLKYIIVNGKPQSDMDGDRYGVPCDCGWWN